MSRSRAADDETASFKPNLRPMLWALLANLLFAATLLGLPYVRGRLRAAEASERFAPFAACVFDGEVVEGGGYGLPSGEEERFASLAIEAEPDWPARCRPALAAVAPDQAIFLFPGVKATEEQLREANRLVTAEFRALETARREELEQVPERPLLAIARLRAALAEYAIAAGVEVDAERDAITFTSRRIILPRPSRVPLEVASGGAFWLGMDDLGVRATAEDSRAVADVRVAEGQVELRRARRPGLVSTMIPPAGADEPAHVVFSTARSVCREDPTACAQRASAVVPFRAHRARLDPALWLRAHPVDDPSQSVWVSGDHVFVLAQREAGALEIRRFEAAPASDLRDETDLDGPEEAEVDAEVDAELGEPSAPEEEETPPTLLSPTATWWLGEVPSPVEVRVLPDPPNALVVASTAALIRLEIGPGATPRTEPLAVGRPRLAACGRWLAVGGDRGLLLFTPDGRRLEPDGAIRPPDAGHIGLVCREGEVDLLHLDGGRLVHHPCTSEACADPSTVASGVRSFSAAALGARSFVAWARSERSAVRVTGLGADDPFTITPAACWSGEVGLCGPPRLVSDGETLLLGVREARDLRLLQSRDGRRYAPLRGL